MARRSEVSSLIQSHYKQGTYHTQFLMLVNVLPPTSAVIGGECCIGLLPDAKLASIFNDNIGSGEARGQIVYCEKPMPLALALLWWQGETNTHLLPDRRSSIFLCWCTTQVQRGSETMTAACGRRALFSSPDSRTSTRLFWS